MVGLLLTLPSQSQSPAVPMYRGFVSGDMHHCVSLVGLDPTCHSDATSDPLVNVTVTGR